MRFLQKVKMSGNFKFKSNWEKYKHSMDKHPDFNFKSVRDLNHLNIEEKEEVLSGIEFILNECELSRKSILDDNEIDGTPIDTEWLKRVNYKIGVKRNQKKTLQNHIRVEKGLDLISSFYDVAKIVLPEETFNSILRKSKEIHKGRMGDPKGDQYEE